MIVLTEIMPLNRATGLRTAVRVSSVNRADMAEANGKNGLVWEPKIAGDSDIILRERGFNGTFAEPVAIPTASISINTMNFKAADGAAVSGLAFQSAAVTIYASFDAAQAWPWGVEFMGRVTGFTKSGSTLNLALTVNDAPFRKSVLTAYTGAGLINGDTDLAGRFIPWLFGTAQNVEPVLINAVDNVWQFSGYGPIKSVLKLYENASEFSASFGNYGTYAALVAAAIPSGRWGTCLALGLIRLGAPNAGVITGDVEGDFFGGVFRTKPGAIMQRIAAHLGIAGSLNTVSLDAFDTHQATRPSGGHIDYLISTQATFLDIAQQIATKALGQAMLSRKTGKLGVCRPVIGAPVLTLDADGALGIPALTSSEREALPYSKVQLAGVRSWRVHTADEIANADIPQNLAELDPPASAKLGGIEPGATVGAALGENLLSEGGTLVNDAMAMNALQSWIEVNFKPSNIAALGGLEAIQNTLIALSGGNIQGIGAGNGTSVANNQIVANADGTIAFFDGTSWVNLGAVTFAGLPGKSLAGTDAAAATKLGGIQPGADVTAAAFPDIDGNTTWVIDANASGTITTGLPLPRRFKAMLGGVDVSTATSFSRTLTGLVDAEVNNTAGADRGVVTLGSGTTGAGTISLTATFASGAVKNVVIIVTVNRAAMTSGGGGGATSGSAGTNANFSGTGFVAVTPQIELLASASGTVKAAFNASYTAAAGVTGRAQLRVAQTAGGGAVAQSADTLGTAYIVNDEAGQVAIGEAVYSGLTPSAPCFVQAFMRRTSGSGTVTPSGTLTAMQ